MRILSNLGLAALQWKKLIGVPNLHRIKWVGKDMERGINGHNNNISNLIKE